MISTTTKLEDRPTTPMEAVCKVEARSLSTHHPTTSRKSSYTSTQFMYAEQFPLTTPCHATQGDKVLIPFPSVSSVHPICSLTTTVLPMATRKSRRSAFPLVRGMCYGVDRPPNHVKTK
uniref:Uncharacterized protein n=1 Tax=Lygus hesperus TaxID=30085 RepID=A0A146KN98_LYGHE